MRIVNVLVPINVINLAYRTVDQADGSPGVLCEHDAASNTEREAMMEISCH